MEALTQYMSESSAVSTRRHPRLLFSVPFELKPLAAPEPSPIHAISLDISQSGLGALVQGNLNVGDSVQVDLPLGDKTLRIVAVVRHTSVLRSGFEFLGLSELDRQQITQVVGTACRA